MDKRKIVVIGGGTGQSIFLRGLKKLVNNITAIVAVSDNGGGSGVLREDLGMLPPGDIRNCIMALADTEPAMKKVMNYRFKEGSLKDQSFGNLFLAALNGVYSNFQIAVSEISNILAVKGKVLPVSIDEIHLKATTKANKEIKGEVQIVNYVIKNNDPIKYVEIYPKNAKPLKEVLDEIKRADIIILGPGSLYTSVITNLLIDEVSSAIYRSKAKKVYVCNVMTQPGETDNYSVKKHIDAIIEHTKLNIIDYVIVNKEIIPDSILKNYEEQNSFPIYLKDEEEKELLDMGIKVLKENLIEVKKGYIRHDALKLAKGILRI